jgi:hypothetical protein
MAMPEALVVPIRMDPSQALSALRQVEQQGRKPGDEVAKGMAHAKEETHGLGNELVNLMQGQAALGALKQFAGAMNDTMKAAVEQTQRVARGFIEIQKQMRSVMALSGQPASNAATLTEVRAGAAANLKPEDWTQFRTAFLAAASNYVGDKPSAKLGESDAAGYQAQLAEYAQAHGVSQTEMAGFAGGLLAQEKGPTTAEKMSAKTGGVFSTLEASSADVAHLLPFMTSVMAQGMSAEQAAPWLAQLPEIAPHEEGTHLLRVLNELRQAKLEGKSEQFGVTKGMGMQEQLEAVITTLRDRSDKGEDLDKMLMDLTHESIAQNTLRGLVGQGKEGFQQWQGILNSTPANALETNIEANRKTDLGRRMHAESQLALREAETGSERTGAELWKLEAEAELTGEKRFDQPNVEDYARQGFARIKGTSPRQQLINERAVDIAFREANVPEQQRVPLAMGAHQQVADQTLVNIMKYQAKHLEQQTKLMEEDAARKRGPALTKAPPSTAGGNGR